MRDWSLHCIGLMRANTKLKAGIDQVSSLIRLETVIEYICDRVFSVFALSNNQSPRV